MSRTTMMKFIAVTILLVACACGCSNQQGANVARVEIDPASPGIVATNLATGMMAEAIMGDAHDVVSLAGPSLERRLSAEEINALQQARVIFTNGPGAEDAAWLTRYTFEQKRVCETTTRSFELDQFIPVEDYHIVHSHDGKGEHTHVWMVPHCWLDPGMAMLQLDVVQRKLRELYVGAEIGGEVFEAGLQSQREALENANRLVAETRQLLRVRSVGVICADPRMLYVARSLGVPSTHLKWFDFPDAATARTQLAEKIQMLNDSLNPESRPKKWLLLCVRGSGSLNKVIASFADPVQIDLIENEQPEEQEPQIPLATRIMENYRNIARAAAR